MKLGGDPNAICTAVKVYQPGKESQPTLVLKHKDNDDIVKALLQGGADPMLVLDDSGETPLIRAATTASLDLILEMVTAWLVMCPMPSPASACKKS